jgi:hypothetical protein
MEKRRGYGEPVVRLITNEQPTNNQRITNDRQDISMAHSGHLAQFGKHRPANTQRLTQRVSECHCVTK